MGLSDYYSKKNHARPKPRISEQNSTALLNKKPCRRTDFKGFTLIEVLIAFSLLSIILLAAYPSYRSYLIKSRRADAHFALLHTKTLLEQCVTKNFSYDISCDLLPDFPHTSPNGYYFIDISSSNATEFVLKATPIDSQKEDNLCMELSITESHHKTAKNSQGHEEPLCWNDT